MKYEEKPSPKSVGKGFLRVEAGFRFSFHGQTLTSGGLWHYSLR